MVPPAVRIKERKAMKSIIARIAARLLTPVLLVLSVIVLFRGHQLPGGGFIAALLAATGLNYHAIVYDPGKIYRILPAHPAHLMAMGLLFCIMAAAAGFLQGRDMLTGLWVEPDVPLLGRVSLGTPLLFDTGIFFIVTGALVLIFLLLIEEIEWK